MEVERKFVVAALPPEAAGAPAVPVRQGYLVVTDEVEVRIRLAGERPTLTVKGGRGLVRTEVELELSRHAFDDLWPLTDGRRIEKVRRRIALANHVAELDQYEGALTGLSVVEVEFDDEADASAFTPPAWFGREVTGVAGWSNAELTVADPRRSAD